MATMPISDNECDDYDMEYKDYKDYGDLGGDDGLGDGLGSNGQPMSKAEQRRVSCNAASQTLLA